MEKDTDRAVSAVVDIRTTGGYRHVYCLNIETGWLRPDSESGPEPPDRVELSMSGVLTHRYQMEPDDHECPDLAGAPEPPRYLYLDTLNHGSTIESAITLAYKLGFRAATGEAPRCCTGSTACWGTPGGADQGSVVS